MAFIRTGVSAAACWPSVRRRDASLEIGKSRSISMFNVSVSATGFPSEKQPALKSAAQSGSENGVVEKKPTAETVSSSIRVGEDDAAAAPMDGLLTLKDYFDQCVELINGSDGGAPRWFTPLECASQAKDSHLMLYLPGVDGLGLGLMLQHERLSKMFDIWCMHIPIADRTSFTDLVEFVESAVRTQYSKAPNRPIYLVGESLGGCLALAVAARNPDIDLILILANPATSFGKSLLQQETLLQFSALIPEQITSSLPYVLTLLLGLPVKVVTSATGKHLPPDQLIKEISQDTTAMSSYLSVLSIAFTAETLCWKLDLLKSAAAFANTQLHAVKAQTLILASGLDQLLPSREEANRLRKLLPHCQVRVFEGKGHALFLEDGISILSILICTCFYRRRGRHDYVSDYFPPTPLEYKTAYEPLLKRFADIVNPVVLSTLPNGNIERSLAGIPSQGPAVYVGNHMLFGIDVVPLIPHFWEEKSIVLRGLSNPRMSYESKGQLLPLSFFDPMRVAGNVPASATNFYRLVSAKSHVLLYPGGAREALHRKGEEHKLFWPEQSEFVRVAAMFGAKIVPFGVVGEDDICHLLFDYDDVKNIPFYQSVFGEGPDATFNLREGENGEVANQDLHIPIVVPKVPGRYYYLFGKPIDTEGRKQELRSKERADELYLEVKSEVERCIAYLKEKRECDPFRTIFARFSYQAIHGFQSLVPTFNFTN